MVVDLRSPGRPSFVGAVRGEVLKLRRLTGTWLAVVLGLGLVAAFSAAELVAARDGFVRGPEAFLAGALEYFQTVFQFGAGALLLAVSARSMGAEYSTGTLRVLLARGAGRLRLLAAKIVALALLGAVVLVAYTVVVAITLAGAVLAWRGYLAGPLALSDQFWVNAALAPAAELVSMTACVALGVAAAVVGRSTGFAIGAAMSFFPADTLYTALAPALTRATGQRGWSDVTHYLLGPNLNALTQHLRLGPPTTRPNPGPVGDAGLIEAAVVIAAWLAVLLFTSALLARRRDVLE